MTDTDALTEALADTLAEHRYRYGSASCTCKPSWQMPISAHPAHVAAALLPVVAQHVEDARRDERERIAETIRGSVSYGFGMNPDGTEDPQAMAYVEGIHTAYDIARAEGGTP
jgi:hypothetical protein